MTATPTQILERLEFLRMRYRMGDMDAATFNQSLEVFQFPDDAGGLWTPGAQSNTWYRWDGYQWTPANPPARLRLPPTELGITPEPPSAGQQVGPTASSARAATCPNCGAVTTGKKFCTQCGAKLS